MKKLLRKLRLKRSGRRLDRSLAKVLGPRYKIEYVPDNSWSNPHWKVTVILGGKEIDYKRYWGSLGLLRARVFGKRWARRVARKRIKISKYPKEYQL